MYGWALVRAPARPTCRVAYRYSFERFNIALYRSVRPDCRPHPLATCGLNAAGALGGTGTHVADYAHSLDAARLCTNLPCCFRCAPRGAARRHTIRSRITDSVPGADALPGAHRRSRK